MILKQQCLLHEKLAKLEILFVAPKSEDGELSMTVLELFQINYRALFYAKKKKKKKK